MDANRNGAAVKRNEVCEAEADYPRLMWAVVRNRKATGRHDARRRATTLSLRPPTPTPLHDPASCYRRAATPPLSMNPAITTATPVLRSATRQHPLATVSSWTIARRSFGRMASQASLKRAEDFVSFLNASPTPFHAVQTSKQRLEKAGFKQIKVRNPSAIRGWRSKAEPIYRSAIHGRLPCNPAANTI